MKHGVYDEPDQDATSQHAQAAGSAPMSGPDCFAVAAPGLEGVLEAEARALGLPDVRQAVGGVAFGGGWPAGARACLWLRTAGAVRVRLGAFRALGPVDLVRGLKRLPLGDWLPRGRPVAVQATARRSRLHHTGLITDAVGRAWPDVPWTKGSEGLHVRLERDRVEVSLDLAGARLHQRGWRAEGGPAPLRETLAAGLLQLCGWDGSRPFVDPMCGSGTLAIEAALLATRTAPGLGRRFAFEDMPCFDRAAWARELEAAHGARRPAPAPIEASDVHRGAVASAGRNAARAGVAEAVVFHRRDLTEAVPPPGAGPGLLLTNPPYGARLDARGTDLPGLYRALGDLAGGAFRGWALAFVTPDARLAGRVHPDVRPGPVLPSGGLRLTLWRLPA